MQKRFPILLFICVATVTSNAVSGQKSVNQLGFESINNLVNTQVKSLKIFTSNEVDGSKRLKASYRYNAEGQIIHATSFTEAFETFEADTMQRVYHYSVHGRSKVEFHQNKGLPTQEIEFQFKGIEVHIFTMYEVDTSFNVFEKWEKLCDQIIDTVKLSEGEKISRINHSISRQQKNHLTITKALVANNRIQQEISFGEMPGIVDWQYDGRNILTKTFYNERGKKYRMLRYNASGKLLEEEQFGAPFNFRTKVEYTATGKVKEIQMLDGAGYITISKKYTYSNDLIARVEQYTSHNWETTFLFYEYSFR